MRILLLPAKNIFRERFCKMLTLWQATASEIHIITAATSCIFRKITLRVFINIAEYLSETMQKDSSKKLSWSLRFNQNKVYTTTRMVSIDSPVTHWCCSKIRTAFSRIKSKSTVARPNCDLIDCCDRVECTGKVAEFFTRTVRLCSCEIVQALCCPVT